MNRSSTVGMPKLRVPPPAFGIAVRRTVLSSCPSVGFIPRVVQGQLQLPHGCLAPTRHETTTPCLSAPLGAPFGPSARSRYGSAYLFPRLSAVGCLASLACGRPPMPSADVCRSVRTDPSALSPAYWDDRQISQGKTQNVPRIDAGFIKHTPCGWRTSRSRARSSRVCHTSYPVPVRRPARLDWASSRPHLTVDALALFLAFGSANTWREDLHLARSVPCLAHTSRLSSRRSRSAQACCSALALGART